MDFSSKCVGQRLEHWLLVIKGRSTHWRTSDNVVLWSVSFPQPLVMHLPALGLLDRNTSVLAEWGKQTDRTLSLNVKADFNFKMTMSLVKQSLLHRHIGLPQLKGNFWFQMNLSISSNFPWSRCMAPTMTPIPSILWPTGRVWSFKIQQRSPIQFHILVGYGAATAAQRDGNKITTL